MICIRALLFMALFFLSSAFSEDSQKTLSSPPVEGDKTAERPAVDSQETANREVAKSSKKSQKGRVVKIDFDDELLIKGKVLGPSLFTLYQKRNVEFGRLIKPRKNFLPEMRVTLGDIE